MKKTIIFLLSLLIIFLFCSCINRGETMLVDNDTKLANKKLEELLDAIQTKDMEALSTLFSVGGRNAQFDQHADELFNYFTGAVLSYDDWGGANVQVDYEDGRVRKIMELTYDVKTTECEYRFAIRYIARNDMNLRSVGIESLYVIKRQDDTLLEYAYWGDGEFTPGINIGVQNAE